MATISNSVATQTNASPAIKFTPNHYATQALQLTQQMSQIYSVREKKYFPVTVRLFALQGLAMRKNKIKKWNGFGIWAFDCIAIHTRAEDEIVQENGKKNDLSGITFKCPLRPVPCFQRRLATSKTLPGKFTSTVKYNSQSSSSLFPDIPR